LTPPSSTQKYALLIAMMVIVLVTQPLVARGSAGGRVLYDALTGVIVAGVLYVVFRSRGERQVGAVLILPALVCNIAHYFLPPGLHVWSAVVFHVSIVAFIGFAVGAILRDVFAQRAVGMGEVLGGFSGYFLAGVAWGNLYALVALLIPESFNVNPGIVWQMSEWHERRALFDYFSFTTLTSLGYGDITPTAPPATSLAWLEVLFGQFYLAAVVAQIVGMKLAQAMRRGKGD
jgi:hypothetical protein